MQGVDIDDASRHLNGAGESDRNVADPHRDRVAIYDDQAALGVDDQAGAVIVALGNAGNRIRHVEGHHRQRRRERGQQRILVLRKLRRADFRILGSRPCHQVAAVPDALGIVALAVVRGEPTPVHAQRAQVAAVGIVHRDVADGRPVAVAELRQPRLHVGQVLHLMVVHVRDHRTARDAGRAEYIARACDIHAAHRDIEVTGLLIGQRVHDGIAELGIRAGSNRMQVGNREFG